MCPVTAELASRSQQSQGTGQVWGMKIGGPGQGLQGWMGYSGAPGRAQQVASRPIQLDQIQARKALSTGLGEEKLQLCLEGNGEPWKVIEQE